jgi:hypothetical protein
MKTLLLPGALALSAFALTAPPASAAITCWYNNSGALTGSDTSGAGSPAYPLGRVVSTGSDDDYAWAYTIDARDGTSCPRSRPSQ